MIQSSPISFIIYEKSELLHDRNCVRIFGIKDMEEMVQFANEMYEQQTLQMKAQEGVTEELKASNQMEWVRRMNKIRNCADDLQYGAHLIIELQ